MYCCWQQYALQGTPINCKGCTLFSAPTQGERAQEFVETWDWRKVADQYASLIRGEVVIPLSPDPFADAPAVIASAYWKGSSIGLPNRKHWDSLIPTPLPILSMGAFALYIDVDIQVLCYQPTPPFV